MTSVKTFLTLPRGSRRLLFCAMGLLLLSRVGLASLRFHLLLWAWGWVTRQGAVLMNGQGITSRQVIWAITLSNRYLPWGRNCLVQALAATTWLRLLGYPACLWIGVQRPTGVALTAHAWVELEGRAVIGQAPNASYTRLLAWAGGRA